MNTRSQPYRQQKKQARLSFQPLPSSSPAKDVYSSAVEGRLANVRFQGSKNVPQHKTRSTTRNSIEALPTPEPSSQPQRRQSPSQSPSSRRSPLTPNTKPEHTTVITTVDAAESEEDEEILPSSKRRRVLATSDLHTPTRESTRLKGLRTPRSESTSTRRNGRIANAAPSNPIQRALSIGSAETSGDEDNTIITQPISRPRRNRQSTNDDPFIVSDDDTANYQENLQRKKSSTSKNDQSRGNEQDFVVADDEVEYISSGDDQVSAKRRKSSSRKNRNRTRQEQDELDEDLKDLQDFEDEQPIETGRTRGGPITTQKDRDREHLELLKRRRAGERIPRVVDSDSEDEQFDEGDGVELDEIVQENPPHIPSLRHEITDIEEQEQEQEPEEQAQDENEGEDEEDDFVVDDESQAFRDHHAGIPLQYTSFASRKPRELFFYLIEWLVKNKIAPAFNRQDELYELSWNKVNDQIKAQAGSRLISSAWNEDFKNTILARPEIQVHLVSEGDDEFFLNCDACNKTNHPARYEFKFNGHAYHKDTLEPIDEDADDSDKSDGDEEESSQENDKASYDQQGHLLPSTRTTFNLGRYCAANAEMGHKLTHWKFHLNEDLLSYLEEQGVLSAEAIVAREKLSKKKREREAENIVDQMKETGVIDEMWRGLQADLEDARFGMEDHYAKGGKRNPNRIGKIRINRGDGRIEDWSEGGRMKLVVPSDSEGE